jgi:CubicO group peptidase (beta-lactamase class C family)
VLAACQASSPAEVDAQPAGTDVAAAAYFPPAEGEWQSIEAAAAGWNEQALAEALAYAREQRSSGLVVVQHGRMVAEAYWEVLPPEDGNSRYQNLAAERTDDGRPIEDVASAQKSVVSFLAGVARGKGLLDFEAPVSHYLGVGWSKATADQEAAIRVHHLMSMSSGLDTGGAFQVPAGEKWMYNTNMYSRMVQVIEAASGLDVHTYTSQWLTERIGMNESRWGDRPWIREGQDANRIGFRTTARDLARFGVLVAAGGSWQGEDVLGDERYLEQAFAPSQPFNDAYGLLWWINGGERLMSGAAPEGVPGPLIDTAPDDLVAAQGALGRKLYVVPSLDLVVSRLGDQPERGFNRELWRRLMAARRPTATPKPSTGG